MIKNFFVTAIRNLRHNRLFSVINILGLVIGISASLVIYLIVHYDFSFDRFEKDGSRIYRIVSDYSFQGNDGHGRGTQAPLIEAVKNEVTGADEVVPFRVFNVEKINIPTPDAVQPKPFKNQQGVVFADEHYFNLLPYKWLAGSPRSALREPGKVVLTESRARLYFPGLGFSAMIGRRIDYADTIHTAVSGVVADLDATGNTDFSFQEFISLPTVLDNKGLRAHFHWDQWGSTTSDQQLYVRLRPGVAPISVEAGLKKIFEKYQGKDSRDNHYTWTYRLQPLRDIHFNQDYGTFGRTASLPTLYGLLLVAGFLLFLACINFINLTTARATQRAREIGIRKTLGSSKRQLVIQFLSETLLITVFGTILSLMLTPILLHAFSDFIPEGVHFSFGTLFRQPDLSGFLVLLVLTVSLLAGFYPALVLSSWQPIQVLKNQRSGDTGKGRIWIRQSLTVSQFVIAQAFIMGTLFVSKQIHYLLDKDLGFKKEAILSFSTPYSDTSYLKRQYLLQEVRKIPGIMMTSLGSDMPSSGSTWATDMKYKDGKKEVESTVELKMGDSNYLRLFHIPLLAGRNVLPSDTVREIVINVNYLHVLGFKNPADALGKMVSWDKNTPIVGVMADFYAHPLNSEDIKPLAYSFSASDSRTIIVALPPNNEDSVQWKSTIAGLEKVYKKVYPEEDFSYDFLDASIAEFYQGEQRISALLRWATGLTILISCLGLFGLVIYTTNRRTKEIGVRKVLGATVTQIVSTLSKDLLKLVALAFIVATPLAIWALHTWLKQFPFRTDMSWWVFGLSGLAMIAIALFTLSIQTIRAARANPVKSLRTE